MLLILGAACFVFAAMNIAFVFFGNPALMPLSIFAAACGIGAGVYALKTWKESA